MASKKEDKKPKVVEQIATTNTGEQEFEPNIQGYSYGSAPDDDSFEMPKQTYSEEK